MINIAIVSPAIAIRAGLTALLGEEARINIAYEAASLGEILAAHGYLPPEQADRQEAFTTALNEFIGNENFEERADASAGWIDEQEKRPTASAQTAMARRWQALWLPLLTMGSALKKNT